MLLDAQFWEHLAPNRLTIRCAHSTFLLRIYFEYSTALHTSYQMRPHRSHKHGSLCNGVPAGAQRSAPDSASADSAYRGTRHNLTLFMYRTLLINGHSEGFVE